jgi:hypothetical protein
MIEFFTSLHSSLSCLNPEPVRSSHITNLTASIAFAQLHSNIALKFKSIIIKNENKRSTLKPKKESKSNTKRSHVIPTIHALANVYVLFLFPRLHNYCGGPRLHLVR